MKIQSHNSWTYLKPKKFWMKLIRFTAKCQSVDIYDQYYLYDVKAFDLRIRFDKNGNLVIAHGLVEFDYTYDELIKDLEFLNNVRGFTVRILHEIRNKKQNENKNLVKFIEFCADVQRRFKNIDFYGGQSVYDWHVDYNFKKTFTEDNHYASVCLPKVIDDWFPWLYAVLHNKKALKKGTDKDLLVIDFVNIGNSYVSKQV